VAGGQRDRGLLTTVGNTSHRPQALPTSRWLAESTCTFALPQSSLGLVLPLVLLCSADTRVDTGGVGDEIASTTGDAINMELDLGSGLAVVIATSALPVAILAVRFPSRITQAIERCSYIEGQEL